VGEAAAVQLQLIPWWLPVALEFLVVHLPVAMQLFLVVPAEAKQAAPDTALSDNRERKRQHIEFWLIPSFKTLQGFAKTTVDNISVLFEVCKIHTHTRREHRHIQREKKENA
jgi:hypothetical protein